MKNIHHTLNSTIGRGLIYLTIFITGSALHELLLRLLNLPSRSDAAMALFYVTLVGFIAIGAVFACQPHVRSRVTSAATLFVLGFIALRLGRSAVPDPYLLLAALAIAFTGAQTGLHRKLANTQLTVGYCLMTIFISTALALALGYGMLVVDIAAVQSQSGK